MKGNYIQPCYMENQNNAGKCTTAKSIEEQDTQEEQSASRAENGILPLGTNAYMATDKKRRGPDSAHLVSESPHL